MLSCICENLFLVTGSGVKERSLIDLLRKLGFSKNFVRVTGSLFVASLLRKVGNAYGATKLNIEPPLIVISFCSLTSSASTSLTLPAPSNILSPFWVLFILLLICISIFALNRFSLFESTYLFCLPSFFLFPFLFSMLIGAIYLNGLVPCHNRSKSREQ